MDYELALQYLQPELMVLVAFLVSAGALLKHLPKIPDWTIPIILWAVGLIYTVLWFGIVDGFGFTAVVFVNGTVQGTLVTALAVFGNQLYKQIKNRVAEVKNK